LRPAFNILSLVNHCLSTCLCNLLTKKNVFTAIKTKCCQRLPFHFMNLLSDFAHVHPLAVPAFESVIPLV
jgi:hypothetical protein